MSDPATPSRPADVVHNYKCATCGSKGHNTRTCGQTPEQRRESRRGRKRA